MLHREHAGFVVQPLQRLHGQPHRIDPDHRSSSRIQPAHSAPAAIGQDTVIVVAPQRTSVRISAGCATGSGVRTGTNVDAAVAGWAVAAACGNSASRTQRLSKLALIPRGKATEAIDMPACDAAATASA
ncbi:hypothetical protein J2W35_004236 [Variovorax boronicumulans]|nr:hypothetical protein [Variovorax boronicumulans]MDQ0083870.1 hypothetical protein [Variovorax boronicumulans]